MRAFSTFAETRPPSRLEAEARLEIASDATALRCDEAVSGPRKLARDLADAVAAAEAKLDATVRPAILGLKAAAQTLIDAYYNVRDIDRHLEPVGNVLGMLAGWFQPFFHALANPPRIPLIGLPLWPAVDGDDIDAVLDFINGITGVFSDALDWVLGGLTNRLEGFPRDLFPDLDPFTPRLGLLDALEDAMNRLISLGEQLEAQVRSTVDGLLACADITVAAAPEFAAQSGARSTVARETHFGSDNAEDVTGLARSGGTAALAEGDVAGAVLYGGGGADTLRGTAFADVLYGGSGDDLILGGDGDDILVGGGGADDIRGGPGDDLIIAGTGYDLITPGPGNDTVFGGPGIDVVRLPGARGDHTVVKDGSVITVTGPDGVDVLHDVEVLRFDDGEFASAPEQIGNNLEGSENDDKMLGSSFDDLMTGDVFTDSFVHAASAAGLDGDRLGFVTITVVGAGFGAVHSGTPGPDVMRGEGRDDNVFEGLGGNDALWGGLGHDTLAGGGGRDRLYGGAGHDKLYGGTGNDRLFGGGGNDLLQCGKGADLLKGGGGNDTFRFSRGDGKDVVLDWTDGQGLIHIETGANKFRKLDIYEKGKHVFIEYGKRGNVIKFQNTDADRLDASDFLFG